MTISFWERTLDSVTEVATLSYPSQFNGDQAIVGLLDKLRHPLLQGDFDWGNEEHYRLLPEIISGGRLWATNEEIVTARKIIGSGPPANSGRATKQISFELVEGDLIAIELGKDGPQFIYADQSQKGRFVTIDDRVVFIGGPSQGGGTASGGSSSPMTIENAQTIADNLAQRFGMDFETNVIEDDTRYVAWCEGNDIHMNSAFVNHPVSHDTEALPKSAEEIVVHEYGHIIDLELADNPDYAQYGLSGFASVRRAAGFTEWKETLAYKVGSMSNAQSSLLSDYAGKNGLEYMAEAFVAYVRGGEWHERIHPDVLAVFQDLDTQR